MALREISDRRQRGVSHWLVLFLCWPLLALVAVLGMKVVPTVVEYSAIKKAIATAKRPGRRLREIRAVL